MRLTEELMTLSLAIILSGLTAQAGNAAEVGKTECRDLAQTVRVHVHDYVNSLPDFICRETVQRYAIFDADVRPTLDEVVGELSFYGQAEHYRVLTVGGKPVKDEDAVLMTGLMSVGEFAGSLKALFAPATNASFHCDGTEKINGRETIRLKYRVPVETSHNAIRIGNEEVVTAYRGRCWIDTATKAIVRLEDIAENIPGDFPVTHSESRTDFGEVDIAGRTFWLPVKASVKLKARTRSGHKRYDFYQQLLGAAAYPNLNPGSVEAVNVIKFEDYHKFETKVRILK